MKPGNSKDTPTQEVEAEDVSIEGDRSALTEEGEAGKKRRKIIVVLFAAFAIAVLAFGYLSSPPVEPIKTEGQQVTEKKQLRRLEENVPPIKSPPPIVVKQFNQQLPPTDRMAEVPQAPVAPPPDPYADRIRSPSVIVRDGQMVGVNSGVQGATLGKATPGNELETHLQVSPHAVTVATRLPDRSFVITQGTTFGNCFLDNAVDTEVPGMLKCTLGNDVHSTDGKIVLIDKGSAMVGEYQQGLELGQKRLFILWTRVETPTGVIFDFASPGTDQLGKAGVGGYIDTKFFDRFGAALLFSLLDDVAQNINNRQAARAGSTAVVFPTNTMNSAKTVAQSSVDEMRNIKPSLVLNQGARVSVMVRSDIDFRRVYRTEKR